jgi:hypothetical protein
MCINYKHTYRDHATSTRAHTHTRTRVCVFVGEYAMSGLDIPHYVCMLVFLERVYASDTVQREMRMRKGAER